MHLSDFPTRISTPWADSGLKRAIPDATPTNPALACWSTGFPSLTFTPKEAGGKGPDGYDTNGVLNALSAWARWVATGGVGPWDSDFATAIGGYPKGARVVDSDGVSYWRNTVDANTADPTSSGSGWRLEPGGRWEVLPLGAFTPDTDYIYRITMNQDSTQNYPPIFPITGMVSIIHSITPEYLILSSAYNATLDEYEIFYIKYNETSGFFEVWIGHAGGTPTNSHVTYITITKIERKLI